MQEGTIARLTPQGFGFIKRDGEEKDLFFHSNELVGVKYDELREGDKLTFEVAQSPKGPNAVKVSRVAYATKNTGAPHGAPVFYFFFKHASHLHPFGRMCVLKYSVS